MLGQRPTALASWRDFATWRSAPHQPANSRLFDAVTGGKLKDSVHLRPAGFRQQGLLAIGPSFARQRLCLNPCAALTQTYKELCSCERDVHIQATGVRERKATMQLAGGQASPKTPADATDRATGAAAPVTSYTATAADATDRATGVPAPITSYPAYPIADSVADQPNLQDGCAHCKGMEGEEWQECFRNCEVAEGNENDDDSEGAQNDRAVTKRDLHTQILTSFGVGYEGDDLAAIHKAEFVDEPNGLMGANDAPVDARMDEVNEAIASQRADGYTDGAGGPVEEISLPA